MDKNFPNLAILQGVEKVTFLTVGAATAHYYGEL